VPRALYWFDRDDLAQAACALDHVIEHLRRAPALAVPEWGIWALLRSLSGSGATEAIEELDARFGPGVVIIDSYRHYAKAVMAGRQGSLDDANRHLALAESVQPVAWFQHNARRLMAETAHADGWGDAVAWLRNGYTYFDTQGDDRRATSCRTLLVKMGAAAPRRRRRDERVPPKWRPLGVSAREADVLELLADARSTRSIAELLHISPKTVERHIGNLAGKLGVEGRTGVVAFAARSAADSAD
jgi:DNA-binding NarL/FixJ family response regulator